MKTTAGKPSLGNISALKGRSVSVRSSDLVRESPLLPGGTLPLLVEPAAGAVDLTAWVESHRAHVEERLHQHGAILFRNFRVRAAEEFERFVAAAGGEPLEYRERSSPRNAVSGRIYSSTEYPADQQIFFHNENSYAHVWPLKLFFFCLVAPAQGGETPLADVRRVYARLAPDVRERFARRGVMYVRNYSEWLGLPWQTVFQTSDPDALGEYCRGAGYEVAWKEGGRLQTRRVGPAVARHPRTGETVWFNHAAFFHITTLEPSVRGALLAQLEEDEYPNQTFYGDGTPIEDEVIEAVRDAYRREAVAFAWQQGDVLMLDNMLVAHARAPFSGGRKILVGMAEPFGGASPAANLMSAGDGND